MNFRKNLSGLLLMGLVTTGLLLGGCGKSSDSMSDTSTSATYLVTISNATTGTYTRNVGGDLGITGLNFSKFAFISHKTAGSVWNVNVAPPAGIVHVAEWGKVDAAGVINGDESLDELGTRLINANEGYSKHLTTAGIASGGVTTFNITVNSKFPLVSFAGMVAPSAAFFTGGHDVVLYADGAFSSEKTVNLYAYSAETRLDADLIVLRGSDDNPSVGTPVNSVVLVGNSVRVLSSVRAQLGTSKVLGTVTFTKL